MRRKCKRWVAAALLLCLALTLISCGNNQGAAQPMDTVSKSELDAANLSLSVANEEIEALRAELSQVKADYASAQQQIAQLEQAANAPATGGTASIDSGVEVWDDEYVNIKYLGCEWDGDDQEVVFLVQNKTDVELTFQANTIALDGFSLGYILGSDGVAAQSTGKVRFEGEELIENMFPATVTATLRIVDFSKTLFGSQSYDAPFVNIDVSAIAP